VAELPRRVITTGRLLLVLAAVWCSAPACAQRWFIEPSIGVRAVFTDNAALGGAARPESELLLGVRPNLVVRGESSRLLLRGHVGLDAITYTNNTQRDVALPEADLLGRITLAERAVFLEGAVRAAQADINPFGPRAGVTNLDNTTTLTTYRISPYVDAEPVRGLHLRARSDLTKSNENAAAVAVGQLGGSVYFGRHAASIEQDPLPLGWRLEAQRDDTRYQNQTTRLQSDVARALVNGALSSNFSLGLRGGAERNNLLGTDTSGSVYGGQLAWRPSQRTTLAADAEHRFFGPSWHLQFSHASPLLAWSIAATRDLDTTPESLFDLPATDNVTAELRKALEFRIPNSTDRDRAIEELIRQRGLPVSLPMAITIFEPRLSIAQGVSATVVLLGARSSLALGLFSSRLQDALGSGPLTIDSPTANNRQLGASLTFSHRLTPLTNARVALDYSRIQTLDVATAQARSKQGGLSVELDQRLAPRTYLNLGVRYRRLASTVLPGGDETSAFAGLLQTF
jgi:uncharacterized protein (PEP-CTERM system associated)